MIRVAFAYDPTACLIMIAIIRRGRRAFFHRVFTL